MSYFKEHFNGLGELITRGNAGCKILARYQAMDLHTFPSIIDHLRLVGLVCDFDILRHMTTQERHVLISHAVDNHEIQKQYVDFYSLISIEISLWVCARTMLYLEYQPFLEDVERSEDLWLWMETGHLASHLSYDSFEVQSVIKHALHFKN